METNNFSIPKSRSKSPKIAYDDIYSENRKLNSKNDNLLKLAEARDMELEKLNMDLIAKISEYHQIKNRLEIAEEKLSSETTQKKTLEEKNIENEKTIIKLRLN